MRTITTFLICSIALFFIQCEHEYDTWHKLNQFPDGTAFLSQQNMIGDWTDENGNISTITETSMHIVSDNVNFDFTITPTTEYSYPLEPYDSPQYADFIRVFQVRDKAVFIEIKFKTPTNFILEYNKTAEVELFQE